MGWQIIHSERAHASVHMLKDYELLCQLQMTHTPILHFYEWEGDSATYGHFIQPFDFLNKASVEKFQLNLAKRPTGGGIVFHLSDFAFSVLVPSSSPHYSLNTLENYAFVNQIVSHVIQQFLGNQSSPCLLPNEPNALDAHCQHFCMAKPTKYDVMLNGRKVGGGAQRRTKQGFLHQATISLAMPSEDYLQEILLSNTCVLQAMKQHSFLLLDSDYTVRQIEEARNGLKSDLITNFLRT